MQEQVEERERYFTHLRFHLKARKRRQRGSAKEYDEFAADVDRSEDVFALYRLLEIMGSEILQAEAEAGDINEMNNGGFNEQERKRVLMGY